MNGYARGRRWAAGLAVIAAGLVVGLIAYNVGLSQGLADAGGSPTYGHWHRPWAGGFFLPLFFLAFFFFIVRGFWWGCGGWGRGGPWGYYRDERDPQAVPPGFDAWHRRAHEQMKDDAPPDDSHRRG